MSRFYITTPIYYVNDLPHIGHIYTTLVCDTVARYRRLRGDDTRFLTGTDEHGQKIEQAAHEAGLAPIELANRVVARYRELWDRLGVSRHDFIRTTELRHRLGVEEVVRRIEANGDLYIAKHEGWYCPACETFYTEKELLPGGLCPDHRTAVEWKSEENLFFRLARYQQQLLDWYDGPGRPVRPASRANEVRAFVAAGLRDLSVSRTSLQWGIPFPGHPGHVVYVWLDALTNYISALGFGAEGEQAAPYNHFWAHGDTRLQMIGKDIIRFHAVYWPAFLMSAGVPLPTHVVAHGWWLRDDRKISKSVGNVARPDELLRFLGNEVGPDALRWFLLRDMVFGQDANFSDEAVIDRYNGDLANGLGNTVSRLVKLTQIAYAMGAPPTLSVEGELAPKAKQVVLEYRQAMEDLAFHRALESLWKLLADVNEYLVKNEPWKLVKDENARDRVAHVLAQAMEAVRIVAVGIAPVMPATAKRLLLGLTDLTEEGFDKLSVDDLEWGARPLRGILMLATTLFPRVDKETYFASTAAPVAAAVDPQQEKPRMAPITYDDFMKVELRVATVKAAEEIPKSNKLVKLTVDLGDEQRTIVAGIRKSYSPEQLVGRQVVVVANLAPAKLMGVESQGMVLAASQDDVAVLVDPEREVPPGTRVR